jgi:hypothetical protein
MAKFVIDDGKIEGHFAGVLGFGFAVFQIDHDMAPEPEVAEQRVDVAVPVTLCRLHLVADKGESLAEFELMKKVGLRFAMVERLCESE